MLAIQGHPETVSFMARGFSLALTDEEVITIKIRGEL
jgi:hypothetical protein